MSNERPPGGNGGRPPKSNLGKASPEGAKVIDFNTRRTLEPEQIADRVTRDQDKVQAEREQLIGDPHSEPPTDLELFQVAQERRVFTWPGMMERAKLLTGEALDTDVLRLLDNQYYFSGDSYEFMGSAVVKGMDHIRTAHTAVRDTNQQYQLCNDAQTPIVVVLLQFIRANNYVERMLTKSVPEPLQENNRWNVVLDVYHVTPQQRDDAFAALSLMGRQGMELSHGSAHQVFDRQQRLAINPLLLRADVRTFLREILQERAMQWITHLTPEDIDSVEKRLQESPDNVLVKYTALSSTPRAQGLRTLDAQTARDSIRTRWIQDVIESYRTTQTDLRHQRNNAQFRRRKLENELDALPQSSRWPSFLMGQRRQRQEAELHTKRADLQEQIEILNDEIVEYDEDIDPQWRSPQ